MELVVIVHNIIVYYTISYQYSLVQQDDLMLIGLLYNLMLIGLLYKAIYQFCYMHTSSKMGLKAQQMQEIAQATWFKTFTALKMFWNI